MFNARWIDREGANHFLTNGYNDSKGGFVESKIQCVRFWVDSFLNSFMSS